MTYLELIRDAEYKLEHNKITLGEYKKMIEPLRLEIPKRGKWICHRDHCENLGVIPSGLGVYEWCSNCDCGIDIRDWQRNPHDFCPNCGCYCGGDDNVDE